MYLSLFLLFLTFSRLYASSFDLNLGTQARTLPSIGAEVFGEIGHNTLVWGEKQKKGDFLYGLIRPNIGASSSAVINSIKGEVEIFPISFIGVAIGRQLMHSNFDFDFFDCNKVNCKGEFQRNYIEGKIALGLKGWFAAAHYKIDTMTSQNFSLPMADWRNVIIGAPRRDIQIEKKLVLGKSFSNKMVGALIDSVEFQTSGEIRESFIGVYQFTQKDTIYMFGAGAFHSDQQPMGFQFYFRLNHIVLPSLKIF